MERELYVRNVLDEGGRPAGGIVCYPELQEALNLGPLRRRTDEFCPGGLYIEWQNGPLGRDDDRLAPNGAFVEDVIRAALIRLECYQQSPFACDENRQAILHLGLALEALHSRTARREEAGIEGTHTPDVVTPWIPEDFDDDDEPRLAHPSLQPANDLERRATLLTARDQMIANQFGEKPTY